MYCSKMVPVIFNNDNNGDLSQVSIYDKNKIRKKKQCYHNWNSTTNKWAATGIGERGPGGPGPPL